MRDFGKGRGTHCYYSIYSVFSSTYEVSSATVVLVMPSGSAVPHPCAGRYDTPTIVHEKSAPAGNSEFPARYGQNLQTLLM